MNKFVFITPMRNAHATLEQMLLSVIAQSYQDWRVILVDDASDVSSQEKTKQIVTKCNAFLQKEKITLITRESRSWETANVLCALNLCAENEIACRLDADDWLTDNDVLSIIDNVYATQHCDALWTKHRWGFTTYNISDVLPEHTNPYLHAWVSSHLKTWRVALSQGVNDLNYRNANNEYVKRAGDQAIYLPVLYKAHRKLFLPLCAYHYTIDMRSETFTSDDAKFQKAEAEFLRARGYVK
jgi:glycosyltransferase involved in cell wall biosynthesis